MLRKTHVAFLPIVACVVFLTVGCGHDNRVDEVVAQPQPFNHKVHTVTKKIKCSQCHQYYDESPAAGMPGISDCKICHGKGFAKTADGKEIDKLAAARTPITWNRLYQLPHHVVFNHSAHFLKKIKCSTCHGDTGISATPTRFRYFGADLGWFGFVRREHTMNWCFGCHKKKQASTDCLTCHQ